MSLIYVGTIVIIFSYGAEIHIHVCYSQDNTCTSFSVYVFLVPWLLIVKHFLMFIKVHFL